MIHPMVKLSDKFDFFTLSFHFLDFDEKTALCLYHLIFSKSNLIFRTIFHNYHVHHILIFWIENTKCVSGVGLELFDQFSVRVKLVALNLFFDDGPVLIDFYKSGLLKTFNVVTLVMIDCSQMTVYGFICQNAW